MTNLENFKLKYDKGLPYFIKLSKLDKGGLIDLLKIILDKKYNDILDNNPRVTKTIVNDEPSEIRLDCYDSLIITPIGINFKPEHHGERNVLEFYNLINFYEVIEKL